MKKSVIIVLKADISEEGIKVDVTDLFEDVTEPEIPVYSGPLDVSLQSPDWISCATDDNLESWYTHYTEK